MKKNHKITEPYLYSSKLAKISKIINNYWV